MDHIQKTKRKSICILLILFAAVLGICCIYLFVGLTEKNIDFFLPKRFIKVAAIFLVSYAIGYSSTVFQTITNNHILTPSVMGFDAMYVFIQTLIIFLFGSGMQLMNSYWEFFICVAVMMFFSWLMFVTLLKGNSKNIFLLVLSGMVLGSLFSSLTVFFQVLLDPNEYTNLQGKMFASFSNVNQHLLTISAIVILLCVFLSANDYKQLDVASLGADMAVNLGVSHGTLSMKMMIITAILMSVSTALVGPITFLGILVVSLSRKLIPSYKHIYRVTASVFISMISLLGGTFLMEKVFAYQMTISMIINFIGGSYFIYLLIREGKSKTRRLKKAK